MSGLTEYLAHSHLARIFVGLTFFLSGLLVNIVQAILYNTLRHVNVDLYRKINYYLTYTIWCQIVALAQHWSGSKLTIYYEDEQSKKLMGTSHTMFLMNHKYEIDWLVAWMCTDQFGILPNSKSFAKKVLRFVPIIGWSWIWNEFAFLQRSYEKDLTNIQRALNNFIEYKVPVSFLFFAEGTRLTESKLEASQKFAQQRGLPIFKHHLLPRTKGFNVCVNTFCKKYPEMLVAQIELRFPEGDPTPNFMSLVRGDQLRPQLYVKIVRLSEIPTDSEEATNNYLYSVFQKKEELVEYFEENNKFPGIKTEYEPPKTSLYNWLAWLVFGLFAIPYCVKLLFFSGSIIAFYFGCAIVLFGFASVYIMVASTKIKKDSKYGTEDSKKKT